MKTKELVRLLQEEDPSGEEECCIGNEDISCLYSESAYWDGCLQTMIHENGKLVGFKFSSEGSKVVIRSLGLRDALLDNPKLSVEYDSVYAREKYEGCVKQWREEVITIKNDVCKGMFVLYVTKKFGNSKENEDIASDFFTSNMSYDDPMPEDILKSKKVDGKLKLSYYPSREEKWQEQWDRELKFELIDNRLTIGFKLK